MAITLTPEQQKLYDSWPETTQSYFKSLSPEGQEHLLAYAAANDGIDEVMVFLPLIHPSHFTPVSRGRDRIRSLECLSD